MTTASDCDPIMLAAEMLATSANQHASWIAAHQRCLSLELIEALKDRYCSPPYLQQDLRCADLASSAALVIAGHLPDNPLASPCASWARGNWAAIIDPQQAVQHYQRAITGYQTAGKRL